MDGGSIYVNYLFIYLTSGYIFFVILVQFEGFRGQRNLWQRLWKVRVLLQIEVNIYRITCFKIKSKTGYCTVAIATTNQQQPEIYGSNLHYTNHWSKRIMQPRPNKYEAAAGDEPDDQGRRRVPHYMAHHPRPCQHQWRAVPPHWLLLGDHQDQHLEHRGRHHWPCVVLSLKLYIYLISLQK